ncbi:hypothetical protein [Actinoplanes sp. NPDC049802]|uniref:hypothetical protein n=1 Tax=Actinoplanes sp. NPDC049802 TaxID=3154742 RepID=UPI0033FDA0BF
MSTRSTIGANGDGDVTTVRVVVEHRLRSGRKAVTDLLSLLGGRDGIEGHLDAPVLTVHSSPFDFGFRRSAA